MDEMTKYEVARQCAQKFNPPSSDEIARTMSNELSYMLVGQGIGDQISETLSGELSRMLTGQGLATDIAEAVAKNTATKSGIPDDAICLFKDGDQWCAVYADFKNIQESNAGFGDNQTDAMADLKSTSEPTITTGE